MHYQPQADPESRQVPCVEALLRWRHPGWGDVPPDEFVPSPLIPGLIRPLTHFVLESAVTQCVAWRDAGTPVQVAVNISMRNLLETDLAESVARLLVRANPPAGLLKVEVTESAIVSDAERAMTALERLRRPRPGGLGRRLRDGLLVAHLAAQLASVQEVKIDRAFVGTSPAAPKTSRSCGP